MIGEFFQFVPREYEANVRFRIALLEWSNGGGNHELATKRRLQLYRACSRDPLFFLAAFCWIFEPRLLRDFVWVPYDFQVSTIKSLVAAIEAGLRNERSDVIQSKSRDMGASWMCVFVILWFALFRKNFLATMVSRSAEYVDSHDPDSLFYKFDYLIRKLPGWLRPNQFRISMLWKNLDRNCFVKGVSTTSSAGVGGRTGVLLLDEFSLMEHQATIWEGSRDVTKCRIANFTLKPWAHTALALTKMPNFRQIVLPWTLHPEKIRGLYSAATDKTPARIIDTSYRFPDKYKFRKVRATGGGKLRSVWYDDEESVCGNPFGMDTEVDMLELAGGQAYFVHDAVREAIERNCRPPVWEGDLHVHPEDIARSVMDENVTEKWLACWCPIVGNRPAFGRFVVGIDTAQGTGASNSCGSVWNRDTGEKVAEYVTPLMDPIRFANKMAAVGWLFRDTDGTPAFLKWESQGPGTVFGKEIVRIGYSHYYFQKNEKSLSAKISDTPGWSPTPGNKSILFKPYAVSIVTGQSINPSQAAMEECFKFQTGENGAPIHVSDIGYDDPSGAKSNHGDRCTADALAWSEVDLESVQSMLAVGQKVEENDNLSTLEGRNRFHKFNNVTNMVGTASRKAVWDRYPYGR